SVQQMTDYGRRETRVPSFRNVAEVPKDFVGRAMVGGAPLTLEPTKEPEPPTPGRSDDARAKLRHGSWQDASKGLTPRPRLPRRSPRPTPRAPRVAMLGWPLSPTGKVFRNQRRLIGVKSVILRR